ncbi:UDP-glucose dehydrogenase family protein [Leptospirillum ferriphilum]|jgi:UDPglucose 6-dehydrogenase|uniref:UDP-glucose dehydrogenase family protein n=1 Tax=Leptospirillum ferriphilum TaxID=178606 RepID=UPI000987943E|nr:nucleotide sugar dehydrogenase [Leptospirillum ferriphilum]OOH84025.1 UDP-glucose 6-dehydrogenase [Leptospirillum ferriphilum]
MKLSVVGLGKLGAPLAAVMAFKGHQVIGIDLNDSFVKAINSGMAPVEEPQLQLLIDQSRERLRGTTDWDQLIAESEVTFLIVPTPSDPNGFFSNRYILDALKPIGEAIRKKSTYHLVVITSTVMPGSMGGEIREALEKASGRIVGEYLGLCYNPEFIALGSVVRDMLNPDFILIGENDAKAGAILEEIYSTSCDNKPLIRRMNFSNAELTKISVNTFVTTKISYANMLADICDRLPGADVDVVTDAVGSDSRIGTKYLKGAMGYGGPCFPRDNVAFCALAKKLGARADLAEATDKINKYQVSRIMGMIEAVLPVGKKVGILGLSYKPQTGVAEESQSVFLAASLRDHGYSVALYDPLALPNVLKMIGSDRFHTCDSPGACAKEADLLIVATPWPEFKELSSDSLKAGSVIIDLWRTLPRELFAAHRILYLGKGPEA